MAKKGEGKKDVATNSKKDMEKKGEGKIAAVKTDDTMVSPTKKVKTPKSTPEKEKKLASPPEKLVYCRAYRAEQSRQKRDGEVFNTELMKAAGRVARVAFLAS